MKKKIFFVIFMVNLIERSRAAQGDPTDCSTALSLLSGIQKCSQRTDGNPSQGAANCIAGFYFTYIDLENS
jgi:hypothetical protein